MSDKYANIMYGNVISAGATIVTTNVQTGASLGTKKGLLIDQIDYLISATVYSDFNAGASGDYLSMAWFAQTPTVATAFAYDNNRLLHMMKMSRVDFGAAATGSLVKDPYSHQFFPALIVAAPELSFACMGSAAISGGEVVSRLYFRYVDLTTQEYLEIAESVALLS